jgi:SnoaL-like domain
VLPAVLCADRTIQRAFERGREISMNDTEKVQWLFDRAQIGEVIHRYPVSIDARDWKLFRSIFSDEIQVYLGPPVQTPKLRTVSADRFTEQVTGIISRFDVTQHFLTDYHVEINGDDALYVSYMQARHFKKGQPTWDMGGYYRYHLIRAGESWQIPKYTLTVTWEENRPGDIRI